MAESSKIALPKKVQHIHPYDSYAMVTEGATAHDTDRKMWVDGVRRTVFEMNGTYYVHDTDEPIKTVEGLKLHDSPLKAENG